MSERVLWLRLCVTGPTPECGEIVGLRIVDRQAHRTVFDAFFHPVREDGWKSVPAGGVNEIGRASCRERVSSPV